MRFSAIVDPAVLLASPPGSLSYLAARGWRIWSGLPEGTGEGAEVEISARFSGGEVQQLLKWWQQ